MADLFGAAGVRVPLRDQIASVQREIGMRRTVYPRRVQSGQMKQAAADREIAAMEAVLDTLREAEAGAADEPAGVHSDA